MTVSATIAGFRSRVRHNRRHAGAGFLLVIAGIASILYSVRPTIGFEYKVIYFFWSFTYVSPTIIPKGFPPGAYSVPAETFMYEILLPWLLIGLFALACGIYLLKNRSR